MQKFRSGSLLQRMVPGVQIARFHNMPRAKTYLAGVQVDLPHECDPRFVEIYPDASPDFFGWMIPTGKGPCAYRTVRAVAGSGTVRSVCKKIW